MGHEWHDRGSSELEEEYNAWKLLYSIHW
jgi:hypothetical protein